jgi:predicted ATPase
MAMTEFKHEESRTSKPQLIQKICLDGLLSFGRRMPIFPLLPLNVLIGPNGAGKSNLIEAISLMRATATEVQAVVRRGGGAREWIWKGASPDNASARIDLLFDHPERDSELWHNLQFTEEQGAFALQWERVHCEEGVGEQRIYEYRQDQGGELLRVGIPPRWEKFPVANNSSILAARWDPETYPELTYLSERYSQIRIYRGWVFGRDSPLRKPQPADARTDRLEEDFSNLGLFLNRFQRNPRAKRRLLAHLSDLYEGLDDFGVTVVGGTVQVFFTEGDFTIPSTRLSDGTLRYLCLLAILCDPEPPPLICLEEPELGLHPDVLPKLADLLVEASSRTQLIVTTHSDILVDALTERPECVVVCEKHNAQTVMTRLDPEELAGWLDRYRLGQLWTRGELGGTRW